jgi:hypothetical protein
LHERLAHDDADHVGRAQQGERGERGGEVAREAEGDGEQAEGEDAAEHLRPGAPAQRPVGEPERHRHGAGRGRGAQEAEPARPDVQHVARVHGQERRRPPEQHGEQVERDAREQQALLAHVAHPREQRRPRRGAGRRRPPGEPQRGDERGGGPVQEPRRHERPGRAPRRRQQQAAEGRAGDGGELPERGRERQGAGEQAPRHQRRHERLRGRPPERARGAEGEAERVRGADVAPAAAREREERGREQGLRRRAGGEHGAPVEAVGDVARYERQRRDGHELREPDVRQGERAARLVVDVPTYGEQLHLRPERRRQPEDGPMSEGRVRGERSALGGGGAHRTPV